MQYTLALTDPDAPSRDNPEWSQICHWIATGIPLTISDDEARSSAASAGSKAIEEIMPYKPPGPPPKTGKHRYVFVALVPKNGTSAPLHLSKPGDRQHWGYKKERQGLRLWAEENGLEVIGVSASSFAPAMVVGRADPLQVPTSFTRRMMSSECWVDRGHWSRSILRKLSARTESRLEIGDAL